MMRSALVSVESVVRFVRKEQYNIVRHHHSSCHVIYQVPVHVPNLTHLESTRLSVLTSELKIMLSVHL